MSFTRMETIHRAALELAAAGRGEKAAIVERYAKLLGISVKRLYPLIKQHRSATHVAPERKRRTDASTTSITDAELQLIAGVCFEGRRAGKEMLSIDAAIDMLHASGKLTTRLSAGRVSTLMRERHMHPDQLAAPTPAVRLRTEFPNELWQLDASVCVLYRTPKGEVALMERESFYKNKLHNVAKIVNDLVVRYVCTDHASGSIGVRFYTGGETTENALAALTWMIAQRLDADGRGLPFYGAPFQLYTDQGSPFKSGMFVNFCDALDIKLKHHAPRNARATGQVENAQNLVERGLEGRLRFIDSADITMDVLNGMADQWMHAMNGARRHGRHGMTRYGAWSLITAEQLRVVESLALLRELPNSEAKRCRVSNDMRISFVLKAYGGSIDYSVRNVAGAEPAAWVLVKVNPFKAPAVSVGVTDVSTGEIVWHSVAPIEVNRFGFDVEGPRFGEYRAMPATLADQNRNAVTRQAYATGEGLPTLEEAERMRRDKRAAFAGQFDPMADLVAAKVPEYLPRAGTAHGLAAREVQPVVLSVIEACKRLRDVLGDAYTPRVFEWVSSRFTEGVPESQIEGLCAQFARPAVDDVQPVGLRAVGGGS